MSSKATHPTYSATYLDWASAAPVSKSARKAFIDALSEFGNPSSPHAAGERAHTMLENARRTIARIAGIKPEGVILTSGATEANNLAIQGHIQSLLAGGKSSENIHLLYAPTCHASIVETMRQMEKRGIAVESLVITNGAVDLTQLKSQIRPETVLLSMDVVCGETGTRWDTRDVRRVLDAARTSSETTLRSKILLHVDASQAAFVESLEMNHLGADLMVLDAQKVGGVRGIGAILRTNPLIELLPLLQGGGQEQGLRPGTESPTLASAFAIALSEMQGEHTEERESFVARAQKMREEFLSSIQKEIPDLIVNDGKEQVPHILNLSLLGRDTDYTVMLLSEAGFSVSTKSACETDEVGSRVVVTMTGDPERALSTLRISWGPTTTKRELQKLAQQLTKTIAFQDGTIKK